MPNCPILIARPSPQVFEGVYLHNGNSLNSAVAKLTSLHQGAFNRDTDAMTRFLIDEHPAGWSELGTDPTEPTGWNNAEQFSYRTRFVCYCHGDRSEDPAKHTPYDGIAGLVDYVLVIREGGIDVREFGELSDYVTKVVDTRPWLPTAALEEPVDPYRRLVFTVDPNRKRQDFTVD